MNKYHDDIFNLMIRGLDNSMQATLSMMYAHGRLMDEANHRREMEQMKREIEADIMSRLSAPVDVQEILDQIEELRRAIEDLGR